MPAGPDPSALAKAVLAREAAATEERHWVRLTRSCNNRCLFCHDSERHDGSMVAWEEVQAEIARGRDRKATRLVLSGGEPTLHPKLLDAIATGRAAGYRWIQLISNGRMFAYSRFTEAAVAAGLDEVTVSMHGHTAELHDRLVGARGAFAQSLRGLSHLFAARRVVSVDVVVCKPNVRHLPQMLRFFYSLGVREFDLLHLIPFGRAFAENREALFFDASEEAEALREAFSFASRPDVHLWANRWPPALLEGAEQLIQDPHKLLDEVRGRTAEFAPWIERGKPPDCQGERCRHCFVSSLCHELAESLRRLDQGDFPVVVLDAALARQTSSPARQTMARQHRAVLRIQAASPADALEALDALGVDRGARLELELESCRDLPAPLAQRTSRLRVRSEADLAAALAVGGALAEIPLDRGTEALARRALQARSPRLLFTMPSHGRLSQALERDLPPQALARLLLDAEAEGFPPCLAPRSTPPRATLAASDLRPDGRLDLIGWASRYASEVDRARSLRCQACRHQGACRGAPLNYVRAHGFGWMRPPA